MATYYEEGVCLYVELPPSAIDRLNSRINSVSSRVSNTEYKVDTLTEDVSNLDDALCEFSTDVDIRVGDVEDALCELSEESEE